MWRSNEVSILAALSFGILILSAISLVLKKTDVATYEYLTPVGVATQASSPGYTISSTPTSMPVTQDITPIENQVKKMFVDSFGGQQIIPETPRINLSPNKNWWTNSGGQFEIKNGIAMTIQGDLPIESKWRQVYSRSNPVDTDEGAHPQNVFRLVTASKWGNLEQQVYYRITKDNLSSSPQRESSNGLFLFNRYKDGENLYYTGIRVDGGVVVKKKEKGIYYTLGFKKKFPGIYDRDNSPNLLPKNMWLGVKSEVSTMENGNVLIKVYLDVGRTANWELALGVVDFPGNNGGSVIWGSGQGGMRTDFMDVEFDDYQIEEVEISRAD